MKRLIIKYFSLIFLSLSLGAFSTTLLSEEKKTDSAPATKPIPQEMGHKVVAHYALLAHHSYSQTVEAAKNLQNKLLAFNAAPSASGLKEAQKAWKAARDAYTQTEVFRFYGSPIDSPTDGPEEMIDAWPIDEALLDSVKGRPQGGIINNLKDYPQITKEVLLATPAKKQTAITGFHAIEFFLWGQDFFKEGPGKRNFKDFVGSKPAPTRRREMLTVLSELLVEQLSHVQKQWVPGAENYAQQLNKEPLEESLRKIYTGVVNLSIDELAGERMTVPLELNDQENEVDCFSDYTSSDLLSNEMGIHNIYFGTSKELKGPGLRDLILLIDPEQVPLLDQHLSKVKKQLQDLGQPFDKIISSKETHNLRKHARATIASLEEQARLLGKSGVMMGLPLNIQ